MFVQKEIYQVEDDIGDDEIRRGGLPSRRTSLLLKRLDDGYFSYYSVEDLPHDERCRKVNSDSFDRILTYLKEASIRYNR